jgi:hypothetical protein
MHAAKGLATAMLNRAQRVGAQAIIGEFKTTAVAIAEAEAYIRPVHQRLGERATKLWIGIHTLPDTQPLKRLRANAFRRVTSPIQKIGLAHRSTKGIETIRAFTVPPWEKRIDIIVKLDRQEAAHTARDAQGIVVATCSSGKNGIVGMGGAICDTTTTGSSNTAPTATYTATLGPKEKFNPYFAELIAISTALWNLAALPIRNRIINILSGKLSALQVIHNPKQQSGQAYTHQIYESESKLKDTGSQIIAIWAPALEKVNIKAKAKAMAKQATILGKEAQERRPSAKATVLRQAIAEHRQWKPIERLGEYTRNLDAALPGKHTCLLYNSFKRVGASTLAQLRTGMIQLNGYLHQIGASETDHCTCGQARETVEHFLFRCSRWDQYRERMRQQTDENGVPILLLGRKGTHRSRLMETKHSSCTSSSSIHYNNRTACALGTVVPAIPPLLSSTTNIHTPHVKKPALADS